MPVLGQIKGDREESPLERRLARRQVQGLRFPLVRAAQLATPRIVTRAATRMAMATRTCRRQSSARSCASAMMCAPARPGVRLRRRAVRGGFSSIATMRTRSKRVSGASRARTSMSTRSDFARRSMRASPPAGSAAGEGGAMTTRPSLAAAAAALPPRLAHDRSPPSVCACARPAGTPRRRAWSSSLCSQSCSPPFETPSCRGRAAARGSVAHVLTPLPSASGSPVGSIPWPPLRLVGTERAGSGAATVAAPAAAPVATAVVLAAVAARAVAGAATAVAMAAVTAATAAAAAAAMGVTDLAAGRAEVFAESALE